MVEVLIAGGGPAGAAAALVLARTGVRVLLVERAVFPRDKLCGDTLNPGTLAWLARLGLAGRVAEGAVILRGMLLTSESGVRVEGRYPRGLFGIAQPRRVVDARLLGAAADAGAHVITGARVVAPLHDETSAGAVIRGAVVERDGRATRIPALVTIAADGRASVLAAAAGLVTTPRRPRRWAVGAAFDGVAELCDLGEMHVRAGRYIGIAPLPDGRANVCYVSAERDRIRTAQDGLAGLVAADRVVGGRFARATMIGAPLVLGPMALDARHAGAPGLLLAGDAAGFIDPMTGDGMRFAIEGGVLAAKAAMRVIDDPSTPGHVVLERWRRTAFARKWRLNRVLRSLVAHDGLVSAASVAGRVAPGLFSRLISVAGDVSLARRLAREDA